MRKAYRGGAPREAAARVRLRDLVLHLLAQAAVERAQRLVHEYQVGLEDQCPGNRHALLLPAGELSRAPVLQTLEADQTQRPLHPLLPLLRLQPPHFQREREVPADGHV